LIITTVLAAALFRLDHYAEPWVELFQALWNSGKDKVILKPAFE
jgi:hypothetical protein